MGGDCINRHRPANCQKCGSEKACGKTVGCFGHLGEICLWIADSSYLLPSSVERSCFTHWNIKYRIFLSQVERYGLIRNLRRFVTIAAAVPKNASLCTDPTINEEEFFKAFLA